MSKLCWLLQNLEIPAGLQERVEQAVCARVENAEAINRMAEIEEIVKRIDFSREQGFLSPQEYTAKRGQLLKEIESLRPIDYDELIEAADLLTNFKTYWDACDDVENPEEARKQLLSKLVHRVFVYDDYVIAIALHGNFSVVLNNDSLASHELIEQIKVEIKEGVSESDSTYTLTRSGSDGLGYISGRLHITLPLTPKRLTIVQYQFQNAVNSTVFHAYTV